jgi:hypothetical protein
VKFFWVGLVLLLDAAGGRVRKNGWIGKTKNPAGFLGEQGSRKIDDLCEIVNYLPASLVRSSLAPFGLLKLPAREINPGRPVRRVIPTPRNQAVACECIGYDWVNVIGFEGVSLLVP